MNDLKQKIRTIPGFPAPGILFRDITTLLADPGAFNDVIERFVEHYQDEAIDLVVGVESRVSSLGHHWLCDWERAFFQSGKQENCPDPLTELNTIWSMGQIGWKFIRTLFQQEAKS